MAKAATKELVFPSAPKHCGRYVIYYKKPDWEGVRHPNVSIWGAKYAAKRFVETLLDGAKWVEGDRVMNGDLEVTCNYMDELRAYKYANDDEREWVVPEPYRSSIMRQLGKIDVVKARSVAVSETNEVVQRRVRAERTPRASRDGLVSVQDIAAELGMQARDARAMFRRWKLDKPACGWAWDAKTADEIKARLKKGDGK